MDIEVTTGEINIEVTVETMAITVQSQEYNILVQPSSVITGGGSIVVTDGTTTVSPTSTIEVGGGIELTDRGNGTALLTVDTTGINLAAVSSLSDTAEKNIYTMDDYNVIFQNRNTQYRS